MYEQRYTLERNHDCGTRWRGIKLGYQDLCSDYYFLGVGGNDSIGLATDAAMESSILRGGFRCWLRVEVIQHHLSEEVGPGA